ncbi:S60 ribosomal protein L36 [Tieghemostelium lacteum]|uniref:S60 ribosomal protein L36 n=1 Tax=Tieghemostelium lacteum TaxID=361077 RepID=A0A151ZGH8_TIELA|nr:S60 ribosomal protein L36 [Tieghemostelium lacteum]|eukprot:KYQ92980.1 S60 ribosomal protein L36 [Tieghemostelium lacteum]
MSTTVKVAKRSGIATGNNSGHAVTKRVPKSTFKKGLVTKRVEVIRDVVREVSGYAPYERRIQELLKSSLDKRALKIAKKRLGSIRAGKKKRDEMQTANKKFK